MKAAIVAGILALAGSAAAYVPMAMSMDRRQAIQTGAAAAAIVPLLRGETVGAKMDKSSLAPEIRIFNHQGCSRPTTEYTGAKTGGPDDEMLVMVTMKKYSVTEDDAAKVFSQMDSLISSKAYERVLSKGKLYND
eukprot:CAMPEP_0181309558 /NCGR_PEP_ID=MMETSP1101-20121128/12077_1 /TAXON_ID=46948 /ORGANISM="Rhodomonas abbreviata, Strain Caron Lab Isolate" /LENGTH=134 /DNA_ID=CAMNT_0023416049 /DNA_START=158 /DNA_END=562 /DNA_ORIENTATION=-